ncbi:hypothetical protein PF005_g26744 [Phytophthora fragariae]|uniref:Uncharacterized protein n=1 Tax=Phytophthora fragariae TaxID=53985 RepID=A0A6A3DIE1_9STRA|nr:hypothetical protein PF003_g12909 [Phytophthora fragariae]KAE8920093.1 hypothetical protein PF009_g29608 [Phytophthora fragariae]KAE9072783.1 hypothetical protein PF010_g25346 [Phytophthora fragariae]KAE9090350.1 hypothetical protein PF006_g25179 [Phytophthora fragariae]KAE9172362.1 hypothetical protein PF005_g26744 [Phytophthora fragariae]
MTTETRIIVRPAPDALRAVEPTKPHTDAPTPSDMEEKPPAPASKKHSSDPEVAKAASAFKKPAKDTEEAKETPASKKHAKDAGEAKKPASKKPKVAAAKAKAKKTSASPKPTRKTKKVTASSKPATKQLLKTKGSSKEVQKTLKLPPKRSAVLLPGPHEDVSSDSSDTDIPNPGYVRGADSPAPRARTFTKGHAASANDAPTSLPGHSPSPHPSLEVDYEESEPDVDHEDGEVEWSPKRITDAQRVLHPGSPMSPKTVVAVERARLLEVSLSRRDDPPAAVSEPQVITNAGVDEGVPPELLQPENRQHLADRTRQEASQAVGTKRDRETHAPRTKDQLLALRYWTRDEYREHLRQSRTPGPGAPKCDKCPVVLLVDTGFSRQRNETEFEGWLDHLGYPRPEFSNSPYLDRLAGSASSSISHGEDGR